MFLTAQHSWRAPESAKTSASPDDVATVAWVFEDDPIMKPCMDITIPDVERRPGDNLLPAWSESQKDRMINGSVQQMFLQFSVHMPH